MAFDAIVIGSGFGGAVAALRLAERGLRVLVLERGRRWDSGSFPRRPEDPWIWDHDHPERDNGWFDLRLFPNMTVAQGAAVGGGSLVYANVSVEAPRASFASGWPPEITYDALKPHYDRVAEMMEVAPVPQGQWTRRMELMRDAAAAAGHADRFRPIDLAVRFDPAWSYARLAEGEAASLRAPNRHGAMQGTCVHLGTCDIGCAVMARNTLDLNYLYVAEQRHGAEIRPLHLADRIETQGTGWRVHFDALRDGARVPGFEDAAIVVLAAGSLGSTELLLRNRDLHRTLPGVSPALGRGWSSNGDFLTPAFYPDREVDASTGPTIASVIDFEDGSVGGRQFWIQDGGYPDVALAYLMRKADDPAVGFRIGLALRAVQGFLRQGAPARGIMPWFAQGADAGGGTLGLDPDGALTLDWDVTRTAPLIQTIVAMHERLSQATGGVALVPPTWSLFRALVTPHPLGGCGMGTGPENGVVDHKGEVFGYRNLYVMDGAVVPRALGVNPSRTIAALAERCAALIAAGSG